MWQAAATRSSRPKSIFDRGFRLSDSPAGWIVSLQGILSGSRLPLFSIDTGGTKNDNGTQPWFEVVSKNMKLDDGDYSVRGRLVTSAHDPLQGSAQRRFFDGGFAVSLVMTPIPEPASRWLVAVAILATLAYARGSAFRAATVRKRCSKFS